MPFIFIDFRQQQQIVKSKVDQSITRSLSFVKKDNMKKC